MNVELLIQHGNSLFQPIVEDGIQWTTERAGSPSILKFTVIKDGVINFAEGDPVRLKVDGNEVFYGFVFTKKRSKGEGIEVTAYDQLRYFKNKVQTSLFLFLSNSISILKGKKYMLCSLHIIS